MEPDPLFVKQFGYLSDTCPMVCRGTQGHNKNDYFSVAEREPDTYFFPAAPDPHPLVNKGRKLDARRIVKN